MSFNSAKFLKKVDFSNSVFKTEVDFSFATFSDEADFSNTEFLGEGIASFQEATFSSTKSVDFTKTKFLTDGGSVFDLAEFSNGVSFWDAVFSGKGETSFYGATFSGADAAIFKNTTFSGDGGVDFRSAEFSGSGGVTFEKAQFSGKKGVNFSEAKFLDAGVANFNLIKHSGEGEFNFYKTEFLGSNGTFFSGAEFLSDGNVYFHNTIFNKKCLIRLDQIQTKNPKNVKFVNVDLGNISFYQTDIEEFRFNNVTFGKIDILICDSDRVNRFIRRIINQLFVLAETKGIKKLNALRDGFNSFFLQRVSLADEEWEGQQGAYDNSSLCGVEILYRKYKI